MLIANVLGQVPSGDEAAAASSDVLAFVLQLLQLAYALILNDEDS